ncbi:hypothetical protein ILUMI_17829 [Ignelater luminosus]|uniref:Galectin n=1 Tax=Ignelater luminosus TaxID=2038154 RepID=A0A8K0G6Y7_IGNLU|nr:hypothetical protein ILUMI_17829 [Ignelater luminosus]
MNNSIIDPGIPYIGPIRTKLIPGSTITIEGTVPSAAYEFNINLQCGSQTTPQDDIAIQITVKLLDGYIALNSLENGVWGVEQRMLSLPIKRAEKFHVVLLCGLSRFTVCISYLITSAGLPQAHFFSLFKNN